MNREFIGYIYKVTNVITGEYYFGKREYRKDNKLKLGEIYLGSGKDILENISKYGKENFTKEILAQCKTLEDMNELETYYILRNCDNRLCLNHSYGRGFGGIYSSGICSNCGRNEVLYNNICMKCIFEDKSIINQLFCTDCNKLTYHYKNGKCMSCTSKQTRNKKWCDFCQKQTVHCKDKCLNHTVHLIRNKDNTVDLVFKNSYQNRVIIRDVKSFLQNIEKYDNGKSILYRLPENWKIKSNNKFVKLNNILLNRNVSNWLKITYKYSKRDGYEKTIILTTDHPLPVIDMHENIVVKRASELTLDDRLIRIGDIHNNQYKFGKIVNIEKYNYVGRSYDVSTETEYFDINNDILSHNCRSFLTPWRTKDNISRAKDFEEGKGKYYGRFNQGVVTVNLPDIAFSAIKEAQSNTAEYTHEDLVKTFWSVFDSRMEICHRALRARHDRLRVATSDLAPIMWQNGALARLEPGESIEPLLYDGYSTLSLGYAGLYECVKAITGSSHTDESVGRDFGLEVMKKLNEYTKKWKADENIDYSLYGTPIESTTYKFATSLKTRFGEDIFKKLDGLDRNYITNSYHVPVFEKIDPFRKLEIESEFQQLSPGGAISYVETADLTNNVQAVLEVIKFIYDNIMYAELNTKSDYCHVCGYDGEIKIVDEEGKLGWECPNCGNKDQTKMNIARRVCGYISTNGFNQGRTNEIRDRYVHLDNCEECI